MKDYRERLSAYQPKPMGEEQRFALFLPLVWDERKEAWCVLYQVRSQKISQPGEVAFPGGRVEAGESFEAAALRETVEELGVPAQQLELWGEIDYVTGHGRTIRCFVGRLAGDWQKICPNPDEVERVFAVELAELFEQQPRLSYLEISSQAGPDFPFERVPGGRTYRFGQERRPIYFYDLPDENLWGLTAQFTARFIEIIKGLD